MRIPLKNALGLKKVCYKVSLCVNFRRQCCKASIDLTNRAKMIDRATPSTWNFGSIRPHCSEIEHFGSIFVLSESAL